MGVFAVTSFQTFLVLCGQRLHERLVAVSRSSHVLNRCVGGCRRLGQTGFASHSTSRKVLWVTTQGCQSLEVTRTAHSSKPRRKGFQWVSCRWYNTNCVERAFAKRLDYGRNVHGSSLQPSLARSLIQTFGSSFASGSGALSHASTTPGPCRLLVCNRPKETYIGFDSARMPL